jgi:hypothetical protein
MSICLRRREFIAGLGGAAAWPLAARAQQGDRVRRIGLLMPWDENDPVAKPFVSALTRSFAGLGWTDGRDVVEVIGRVEAARSRHVLGHDRGLAGQMLTDVAGD